MAEKFATLGLQSSIAILVSGLQCHNAIVIIVFKSFLPIKNPAI